MSLLLYLGWWGTAQLPGCPSSSGNRGGSPGWRNNQLAHLSWAACLTQHLKKTASQLTVTAEREFGGTYLTGTCAEKHKTIIIMSNIKQNPCETTWCVSSKFIEKFWDIVCDAATPFRRLFYCLTCSGIWTAQTLSSYRHKLVGLSVKLTKHIFTQSAIVCFPLCLWHVPQLTKRQQRATTPCKRWIDCRMDY